MKHYSTFSLNLSPSITLSRAFLLPALLSAFLLGGCDRPGREAMARNICDGAGNCSYSCPDGTVTSARFPRCPVNDRDLLPPANEDVGPPR